MALAALPAVGGKTVPRCEKECCLVSQKSPPLFVIPTGFDPATGQDAVERRREAKYANYISGAKTLSPSSSVVGKPFVLPKRSIVQVAEMYRDLIEERGELVKTNRLGVWVPVRVVSLPPTNNRLLSSNLQSVKNIAKPTFTAAVELAQVGDTGFVKVSDLEKIDKQRDYVFIVKRDTELFKSLNETLQKNNLESLQPYALRLKESEDGFEVRQCCSGNPRRCQNFPIFEVLNVRDRQGRGVDMPLDEDCLTCRQQMLSSLTPIEEHQLKPIRSILSHPSLGLPSGRLIASLTDLNFVDSRGFVQIPLLDRGEEKRIGPFNSRHYGPESGDADVYMRSDVACGFMQFLKAWDQACKGHDDCLIEFGDASHALHKNKVRTENSPWPHESHTNGECLDINTSRMSDRYLAPMIKMLQQLGPNSCLTLRPSLLKGGGCSYDSSGTHETHMHICFPSNLSQTGANQRNAKLDRACQKGVEP